MDHRNFVKLLGCCIMPCCAAMTKAERGKAIDENKLLIVDYHDAYLPFLDKINALDGRKAYATRTIYFLNPQGTLKPIAIELALLPGGPSSQTRRVVTLPVDATSNWIWQLAKARVSSNDAGIHQPLAMNSRLYGTIYTVCASAYEAMHPI
ncbi:hypothetical protein CDL15_Pgr013782 [Punica granatum]|uniref:Lipoxygenase domain-containing protein n=1 Tax=Punica granatum TaxID=22663 RepID=A0A218W1D6_PUNGR|nr:hypothetical protein CDL15_Pgr013782 [Punica granatum]